MKLKRRGFTLVEVIVGMSVLALLAAISIVPLISYIDKANQQRAIIETRAVVLSANFNCNNLEQTVAKSDNNWIDEVIKFADVDGQIIEIVEEGNEIIYLHYRSDDNIDVIYDVKESEKIKLV